MNNRDASIATRRFGLGPKRGDLKRIAADPRGYVLAALQPRDGALIADAALAPSHVSLRALREAQIAQREARQQAKSAAASEAMADKSAVGAPGPEKPATPANPAAQAGPRPGGIRREVFREEALARLSRAVTTDQPFLERLVMFWSNHFAVSAQKGPAVRVLAGAFEREAIRPHVLGRFADMLKAVEQHPAMLIYLDNAQSIGPTSPAGRNRGRGLNENLAREILELHTLGVDGGYTQADVTSFAKVITGWSLVGFGGAPGDGVGEPGTFAFFPRRHEPGDQTVVGQRYADRGQATGETVLADLARHRATARHVAVKLARHFISQSAPPRLVDQLETTFRTTDGDLAALARTLVSAPESWEGPAKKVVPPYDFGVSLVRAFDLASRGPELVRVAAAIGQPLWAPPSPKGWPDDDDAWMGPSAIRERLRIAERVAREIDRSADPRAVAEDLLGASLSSQARQAIERAEVREQGLELLVMSPEFLRR